MRTKYVVDPQARRQIAAAEIMPEATVNRVYRDPQHVKPATFQRVTRAAIALGVPVPTPAEQFRSTRRGRNVSISSR